MYSIIRFRKNGQRSLIEKGLTLEQAKEHCRNPLSKGADWFDGFQKEEE